MKQFLARLPALFLILLIGLTFTPPAHAEIRYEVSLEHPEQHLFHVTMVIPNVTEQVTVQIPAWNALYQIRDFSSHIQRVEATESPDAAEPGQRVAMHERLLTVEKVDKQTWRIAAHGTVKVRYATYWDEAGPFATQLNQEHAFINPAMILMYVPERRFEQVRLDLPDVPEHWRAIGPGIKLVEAMGGAGNFSSAFGSYDQLVDAPIEAGKFEQFMLEGFSPAISVVIHGDGYKKKDVEAELRRICKYEIDLMRGAPYPNYTFILHIGKGAAGAGGGMEHADGTAIFVSSGEFLSGVAAHEFFHLWNVKRIRPATLYPVDYTGEQYTRALWFAEGVTSTYGAYTLERSGIWSKHQLYHDLAQKISELESQPANHWQSVEQSSLDAWLEKYPLYERPENSVSYYTKGQVLGVLLDIMIRGRSGNEKSLDDLVRAMNEQFGRGDKAYRDSLDVQRIAEQLAGGSFEEFFTRYVAGADALPYRATLQLAGLDLRETTRSRATLGITGESSAAGLVVRGVEPNGPAAAAAIQTGDVIVKWNGTDPPRRPGDWLSHHKAGEPLHLRILREQAERDVEVRLGEISETYYDVVEDPHADEKARQIREGWLRGVTNAEDRHTSN